MILRMKWAWNKKQLLLAAYFVFAIGYIGWNALSIFAIKRHVSAAQAVLTAVDQVIDRNCLPNQGKTACPEGAGSQKKSDY
jgi:hypothetical protein